jgi:hypothetical protein
MNPEGFSLNAASISVFRFSSEINLEYAKRAILTGLKQRLRQGTDGSLPGEKVLSFVFHEKGLSACDLLLGFMLSYFVADGSESV